MCGACNVSTRQALKARDNGEHYQLRWLRSVLLCDLSWGGVCNSIGIANVSSPVNCLLCLKHYHQGTKACIRSRQCHIFHKLCYLS